MKRFLILGTLVVFASVLCLGVLPTEVLARPSLEITKTLTTTGDIQLGDDVEFEITVTNTGDENLINVEVTDSKAQDCYRFIGDLVIGASVTYNCTAQAVTNDFLNRAYVRGSTLIDDCPTVRVTLEGTTETFATLISRTVTSSVSATLAESA